jgi:hypothetical protein
LIAISSISRIENICSPIEELRDSGIKELNALYQTNRALVANFPIPKNAYRFYSEVIELEVWDILEAAYVASICLLKKNSPTKGYEQRLAHSQLGLSMSRFRRTSARQEQQTERKRREYPRPGALAE